MRRDGLWRMQEAALDGLSTGIGSLPAMDPAEAVRLSARCCPGIPFWPQLPGRDPREQALEQGLAGLEDLISPGDGPFLFEIRDRRAFQLTAAAPPPWGAEHASGLVAFEAAIPAGLRGARALKGQLIGPITLAASLRWQGRPIWEDAPLLRALGVRAAWQVADQAARLRRGRVPVILALDEPSLGMLPAEVLSAEGAAYEALIWALAAIQAHGAVAALHCCSTPPWGLLTRLPVDLISFDASRDGARLFDDADGRTLAATRWVAWGLVPTDADPAELDPTQIAAEWLASVPEGLDPAVLAHRALVTPACGLAGVEPARAESLLGLAGAVGAEIRRMTLSLSTERH